MTTLTIYDRDGESIDIELPDDTRNYWDMHPQRHGGLFADFEESMVRCVVTIPPYDVPGEYTRGNHVVTRKVGYYDDMIRDTDGASVATGPLKDEINASAGSDSLVQAATGGYLPGHIAWACKGQYSGHEHFVSDDNYTETLIRDYNVPEELL